MAIDTPSKQFVSMMTKWELPMDLLGGTPAMRDAATKWLPQEPNESNEAYRVRLNRTFLFNIYKRTVDSLVGSAFNRNVEVNGVPEELGYLEWNADGQGQSLTEFCAKQFHDTLVYGKAHIYTDFPEVDTAGMNYAEYMALGLKPYFARLSPTSVIGWNHSYNNGFEKLNYVRIRDDRLEEDENTFEQQYVTYVRYVSGESIRVYRNQGGSASFITNPSPKNNVQAKGGGYEEISDYENYLKEVPISTAYSNKLAPFVSEPPLADLAWMNLCHYQSSSDQRNILHIARVPFLLGTGFEDGEVENVTISANRMVLSTNNDADIKYVEHTGQAIAAGRQDLKDMEEQCARLGAEILFSKSVARQTAEARRIDQAEALSVVQTVLRSIEQSVEKAYGFAAKWLDIPEDKLEKISINIGVDLEMPVEPNPVEAIAKLQEVLGLSDEKLLEEAKRRKLVAPHLTVDDINIVRQQIIQNQEPETDVDSSEPDNEEDETDNQDREDQQ